MSKEDRKQKERKDSLDDLPSGSDSELGEVYMKNRNQKHDKKAK